MTSIPNRLTARERKPRGPGFLDRFMDSIQRLPIPYGITYLLLFILESLIIHVFAWINGWLPVFSFNPILLNFPMWQWLPLAIITFLDSVSSQALSIFKPLLDVEEVEFQRLKDRFANMPSRGVFLNGVIWTVVYIVLTNLTYDSFYVAYGLGPTMSAIIFIAGLVAFLTGSVIYYHSLRQLVLINQTVKMVRHFNMFQLDPVYAFSRVTSLIGVSWMIMLSLTLLLFPTELLRGLVLSILVLQVILAVAAFVLPLWFVHRRLESEKLKLLAEFNRQVESTTSKLHAALNQNEMGQVTQLKDAILGLTAEHEILNKIPTWPWRSGTITGFLSAAVLPIVLFLIQILIQKLMGK